MSNFPNRNSLIDATIKGIKQAKDNFLYWTNDRLYLSYAPAKMLSIHIAQEISKLKNAPEIYIDATISDILRCSLKDRGAFLNYMDKHSIKEDRFSITLDKRIKHKNNNDSISKVIMTVKNGIRNIKNEYSDEIEKICKMLDSSKEEESSLEYGLYAFYTDLPKSARKKLKTRIPQIIHSFNEVVQKYPNLKSSFVDDGINEIENIGEWSIGVYLIERIKGSSNNPRCS